jgi:saccharopine dehydrogenase-like NADP-dependent oxidoreductase
LVAANYVDESSMAKLSHAAEDASVAILCEMCLDPGIDYMMAMKMMDEARFNSGSGSVVVLSSLRLTRQTLRMWECEDTPTSGLEC